MKREKIAPERLAELIETIPEPPAVEFEVVELRIVHRKSGTIARVAGVTKEEARRRAPGQRSHIIDVAVPQEFAALLDGLLANGVAALADKEADIQWQASVADQLRQLSRPANGGQRP